MFLAGYRHIQGFQGDTAGERTQDFLSLIIVYKSVITNYGQYFYYFKILTIAWEICSN